MIETRRSLLSLLNGLRMGAVIVDYEGLIIDQNSCAEPYFKQELRSAEQRIIVTDHEANFALRGALAEAALGRGDNSNSMVVVPHPRQAPSIIRLIPISPSDAKRANILLILLNLGMAAAPSLESLVNVFDLTRAEARLATRLAAGSTLGQIARASNLSIGTVRIQLKSIFLKTRTHRQAELVSLLARLAVVASPT